MYINQYATIPVSIWYPVDFHWTLSSDGLTPTSWFDHMLWHIGHPQKAWLAKPSMHLCHLGSSVLGGESIAWFVSSPGFARSSTTGSQHMAGGCGWVDFKEDCTKRFLYRVHCWQLTCTFEDDVPFCKVGHVSFLERSVLLQCSVAIFLEQQPCLVCCNEGFFRVRLASSHSIEGG